MYSETFSMYILALNYTFPFLLNLGVLLHDYIYISICSLFNILFDCTHLNVS